MQHVVIGGGIVGLAVGAALSKLGSTMVIERHAQLLHETSSRNSGVVHAGIYYPADTLKTKLCMEGNQMIWELAEKYPDQIHARKCGKWIGAVNAEEETRLHAIIQNMDQRGIAFEMVSNAEARKNEPLVQMKSIVLSKNTGIIDVHSLANYFVCELQSNNDSLVARGNVCKITTEDGRSFNVTTEDGSTVSTRFVVNAAGLHTERVWKMLEGTKEPPCRIFPCKGRYVGCRKKLVSRLVYPCPLANLKGLGVHSVVDMAGAVRFGPDAIYTNDPMDVIISPDEEKVLIESSYEAIRRYLPTIKREDLFADFAGVRPKLGGEGDPVKDFVVRCEDSQGLPNFVSLCGIESPGMTAAPAIAKMVHSFVLQRML